MNKAFESAERVHINESRWRWWWHHRTSYLLLLVYCIKSRYFLVLVQDEEEEEERFCRLPPQNKTILLFFLLPMLEILLTLLTMVDRLCIPYFALVPSPSPFPTLFFSFFFLPSFSCHPLSSPDLYNYAHLHLPSKYKDFLILSNAPLWLLPPRINNKSPSMGVILLFTLFTSLYATDGPARQLIHIPPTGFS